jgi:GTPase SAR1 family protein
LVQFNIDYNPLISPPLTIAQQGLEAIRHYFEAESNNRLKTLKISNKKVLLVGEGEVGKTSFFQALKRETNQFESETNERTKGIDVHSLELKNGAVSIWDFAGQEEFFSSHNIFTKDNLGRSLFIVVFRLHDGDEVIKQSIKKWTSIALEQSPQSNIILVGTHLDKVEDVEEQKKFIEIIYFALEESVRERIKELFCVSNETKQGIEQVKAFIDDQIQQEFNLPSICVEVFEQIKHFKVTEKKEYIFADEITVQISQDILNIALAFFHSVGEMIHFIDSDNSANNTNKNTKNLIILNPDWLSKQMAKLIQKGKKYSTQGWISVSTCFGIWNIDKNIGEQLILIMHRIKLVYFDKRKNEVLVNQLLPATNNQDFIDEPIKYGRIWQFNFVIPMGLFEHVHFNLLELKLFDIEAWKNYLKLEQGESTAIIQIFNDGEYALAPQLRVIACGNEKSSIMMKIMVEFIDGLLKEEFKNSKFIRRVCCTCEQCLTNMKINGELCHWPLSDEDKLNNERGMHSILSRSDTVKCSISKSVLPLNKIQFEKNIDNSESHSTKSLNKISAATRAEIASEIATRSNWDRLGLQFEKELGKTFPRMALVAEQGEHAPPITLVQHLIEKLAAMLLSVSSFKAALVKLGMPDIAKMFAKDLDETSAPTVNQPQGNYNNNAYQHQRKKATLVEVNPKHAAEHFSTKLVFDIQGAVTIGYKELAKKVGWTRIGQLVNHMGPDNEIASLLELIYKQQGHAGLKKIRDALASASEIRALDIIDNSPCATMFQ